MSKAPTLSQKVANIQHMPVLITATSASKAPLDGFITKDIVKMTYESTQTRVFLQQYLINQLCSTSNVFVKIRVLSVVLLLLNEGHIEFKQNLRQQPEAFNEASKLFPHQPLNVHMVGECGRIRDLASRILDLLFEDTPELRRKVPSYVTGDTEGQSSSNKYSGFGNDSSYQPPSKQEGSTTTKILKMFSSGKGSKDIVYDPNYATSDPVPFNQSSSSPFRPQINLVSRARYSDDTPSGKEYVPGKAGGGWDEPNNSTSHSVPEPYSQEQHTQQEHPQNALEELSAIEDAGTEQERRLVEEITAPGGVKVAPPRDMLTSFISRCRRLDCQAVVEYLGMKLRSEESRVVLRALFVVEAMSRSDLPDILSQLDMVLEELTDLSHSQTSSVTVKTKSNKILMQLTAQTVQGSKSATQLVEHGDIVDTGVLSSKEEPPEPAEGAESGMTTEQADLAASLFTGMSLSGEKSVRPKVGKPVKKQIKKEPQPVSSYEEDLLGLGTSCEQGDQRASQSLSSVHGQQPADDSLLMFGSDEEDFDPLKRTNSVGKTNTLSTKQTNSFTIGQTNSQSVSVAMPTSNPSNNQIEPANNLITPDATLVPGIPEPAGSLGELIGLDMSKTTPPLQHQEPRYDILQPLQSDMPTSASSALSSANALTREPDLIPLNNTRAYAGQGSGAMAQGCVVYTPMGPQHLGGGGAMVQQTPVMYVQVGGQRMTYNSPQQQHGLVLGREARPVQRATTTEPSSDSGFSFLDKSSRGGAFDFVQEELRANKPMK